jgi:diguanylate cyclase (GGDEF)-like protein/PAS domain S-box-containing protein
MADDNDFYKNILENLYDGVYLVDRDRKITYWNRGAEEITGYVSDEVVGTYCFDNILRHVNDLGLEMCEADCPLAKTLEDGARRECDIYLRHKQGHRLPIRVHVSPMKDKSGEVVGAVEIFCDNSNRTLELKEIEDLKKLALLDPLTDLANRRYGEMQLHARLNERRRYEFSFGVLFIDIDNFKRINDTFGHDVGDEVLRMVSRTLENNVRSVDLVCRWGGEEFVAFISHIASEDELFSLSEKLRVLVSHSSISSEKELINPHISIGATLATSEDTEDSLLKRADRLMYQSKQRGGNSVTVRFDEK